MPHPADRWTTDTSLEQALREVGAAPGMFPMGQPGGYRVAWVWLLEHYPDHFSHSLEEEVRRNYVTDDTLAQSAAIINPDKKDL